MKSLLVAALFVCTTAVRAVDEDILIADFEGDTYGTWKVEGTAFGKGPAKGTLPGQMAVGGFRGNGLVNSFVGGDRGTGKLTSPAFTIERDYLNFLIGGGGHADQTCLNLLLDGKVVRTATGPNVDPGGSEALLPTHWNVKEFRGKKVTLQIVDSHTGGWGHINVDHIVQSNAKLGTEIKVVKLVDRTRLVKIEKKYLLFPVSNSAKVVRMTIEIEGKMVQDFDINLASGKAEWWGRMEMPQFLGQTAKISAYKIAEDNRGLSQIESSDELRHTQPLYREALRPQLRFSQMQGWNNDPNGMVFHDGEWHLFWQSNPFGPKWGNMYWGHAVSKDLVHWEELPYALYPRVMAKNHCFSGSANIDTHNTGGWGKDAMIAAFTDTGAGETLAISNDKGRTWKYYEGNPVIGPRKPEGRDPKLVWYEPGKHWVIAVYTKIGKVDCIEFYTSKDLKKWEKSGQLPGYYECPELFELPVDGDATQKKWVVTAADGQYAIGHFDGKTFTPDHSGKHQIHYGALYAAQCFSRAPGGRVIQIGWARLELPNMPFNQAFTLPIELKLKTTKDGVRMLAEPIKELESLRLPGQAVNARVSKKPLSRQVTSQLLDIELVFEPKDATELKLTFGENTLVYNVAQQKLDGMPLPLVNNQARVRVVVDRPMYEVIGNNGTIYKTSHRKDGGKDFANVEVLAVGGSATVVLTVYPLKSIWKQANGGR